METGDRSARNELFQELKPYCVELSQLALRNDESATNPRALIESAKKLLEVLQLKCRRDDGVFDEKLADYVFFPLSQILRRKQIYTDTLSELTIQSLGILLEYGWRRHIALDLAKQLLILLTFVAGGVPGQATAPAPEELLTEAYGALTALIRDISVTPGGPSLLIEADTIPALGHAVTVILDGIKDGPSVDAQIKALRALATVWSCIRDQQALSTFLPGTISALTKCLMPSTASRRSRQTIIVALGVLEQVLVSILSDIRTHNIRNSSEPSTAIPKKGAEQNTLTKPWLKATAGQIKLALSNIIKLRTHESTEVRSVLNKLCITILDECHSTLAESSTMLVETCMTLTEIKAENDVTNTTTLTDLARIHPDLGETIKLTVYNWITSLPRIMQSNDEAAKHVALDQLSNAQHLLAGLNLDSAILEDALGNSLRDSITVTLEPSSVEKVLQEADFDLSTQYALTIASANALSTRFSSIVMPKESQKNTRADLTRLIDSFSSRQSQISMASEMLDYVRGASGLSLLSAYWLSSQLLRSAALNNRGLDEFIDSALIVSNDEEIVQQELFSFSQTILSNTVEEEIDWRLQAIALEVIADRAQKLKSEFRTELVDTLYPIAQLLGSPNPRLRQHAITCLNIVSTECGYNNAGDLIINNVDYLVNAISLRLNTFDISPQAPRVLVMMIRLAGPSLLLYLDDVVGSIFAALDNFHGYHRLVEMLFSVLGEIVDVGSKSGLLQITSDHTAVPHRRTMQPILTISDIIKGIGKKQPQTKDPEIHEDFPAKPWKDAKILLDEAEAPPDDVENGQEVLPPEVAKPPPTKVYTMVQSIARLGQHYLTNESPILRAKLLGLISTACNALHNNEDEFLPLINDIWPVVIKRLYDDQPFVSIAAADTVANICRYAGDFMATRLHSEWNDLMKVSRQARTRMLAEKKSSGGRGIHSQVSQVWESVVRLLIATVENVRIEDEMFDEVLEILEFLVSSRTDVRDAFALTNADAVWLTMHTAGVNKRGERPILEGYSFDPLD